jgi:hypothetical protein
MNEPHEDVKLTVNVVAVAFTALERAAGRRGLSRTDVVSQALQLYDEVTAAALGSRAQAVEFDLDGDPLHLVVFPPGTVVDLGRPVVIEGGPS